MRCPNSMGSDGAELDRLLTLCEVSYYNHLRAMSLLEEGKVSEHFVSGCDAGRRMARENLHDYIQRTYGVGEVHHHTDSQHTPMAKPDEEGKK